MDSDGKISVKVSGISTCSAMVQKAFVGRHSKVLISLDGEGEARTGPKGKDC